MTTGLVFHERYLWHDTGHGWIIPNDGAVVQPYEHPENPETKRRFMNLLRASGMYDRLADVPARPATVEELCRVHTLDHVQRMEALSKAGGGDAGGLTPIGLGSYEIALLSAGGCIAAVEAVLAGRVDNAYALVRPPGHHSIPDGAMGFCMFNNAAIAVQHLRAVHGVGRVAMVDWDVHHGNGQQAVFWEDPDVLTISIHQDLCFPPDSGYLHDIGGGAGEGYNVNVPLPPGSGHGAYVAAYERVAVEALRRFRPDFIVAPSGFDGGFFDPLGRMMAWSETFRDMTRMLKGAAEELCGGRLVLTHEGGYSQSYVPFMGLAVLEELSGERSGVDDPYAPICSHAGQQDLQSHQDAVIRQAEALLAAIAGPA
jgi:acetoin utilization deacetylase AcuC-like enzyme